MYIQNNAKDYKSTDHLFYSCQYHVIFCPKYRKPIIKGEIEKRLKEILNEVANENDFQIVEMETMPDHIHMIVDCNPRFGIMECIKKMKSVSARTLRSEFPRLMTSMPNLWTRSAFISTVGSVSLEVVKQYIANQKDI